MDNADERLYTVHLLDSAERQVDKRLPTASKGEIEAWTLRLLHMAKAAERELQRRERHDSVAFVSWN